MQHLRHSLVLMTLLASVLSCMVAAAPSVRVKRQQQQQQQQLEDSGEALELNPIKAEEVIGASLERNKRKLPDATFEAKNAVLGFVFGGSGRWGPHRHARSTAGKDLSDAPELDRSNVSFELPDELFNKSFQTVTNVSKSISRLIMNSARRYSRFVLFFKPMFGNALVVKGYEEPATTTRTTTEADMINEI